MKFSTVCMLAVAAFLYCGCDSGKTEAKGTEAPAVTPAPAAPRGLPADIASITANFEISPAGAQVGKWTMDYQAALKLAAEKKIPVLLNFTGSDWCQFCKYLTRDVFNQQEWQTWSADKLIMVYVDFPRNQELITPELLQQNTQLREQFGIEAFPTLILLEDNGAPLGIVELRESNTVQSVKRSLKALCRRRKAVVEQMIAALPEAKRKEVQSLYDTINANRQKMTDLAKQYEQNMKQIQDNLQAMSEQTEQALLESILSQRTPEQQKKYADTKQQLESLQRQLQDWLSKGPENNQQNMLLFNNFQKQLQELNDILSDIIDPS